MLYKSNSHCEFPTGAKAFLIFFFVFFFTLPLFAQHVDTSWVRRYNEVTNPTYSEDKAHAIAVDGSGNAYVTGWSNGSLTGFDYATIKYYPNGDTAWVRRYNACEDWADRAYAIVVDSSGNVYVTGMSFCSGTGYDYATIKYKPNGDTAWVRRYNGPGNGCDSANAIVVHSSGNVYVTGASLGSGTGFDYATVKYYPNGDTGWVRRYNGPGNDSDEAHSIAVDGSGNVYVTGASFGSGTGYDYATIKYYPNGDTAWVRRYNGPGNDYDIANRIAVDGSGNVYVTGKSIGSEEDCDYATIKYKPNGDTAWVRRYDGPRSGPIDDQDEPRAVVVDNSHNVYVTGQSGPYGGHAYVTIKYFPNGDTAWLRIYNGNWDHAARAIALDDSGNVYVTGSSWRPGTIWDYLTIKYDPTGNICWAITYDGGLNGGDYAQAIAVGGSNNVYVTGVSWGTDYDYATIKYWQNSIPNSHSLISPLNADSIKIPVTLIWQKAIDLINLGLYNDTVIYDLYLSRSIVFNPDSTIVYDSLPDTTLTNSLGLKLWYWKVKAYDRWGAVRWSDQTWSFYVYLCGDCNGDGTITVSDVVYEINYLFKGGFAPKPAISGNVNCDDKNNISDVVYLINYLFKGGPKPCQDCP
jgi:hypothetical protein